MRFILTASLIIFHSLRSFGQYACNEDRITPDTLNFGGKAFNYKTDLSDSSIIKRLDKIAKQITINRNCNFTVLISDKGNKKQKQSSWERGYNIIMYLIDNYHIENTQLIFLSDRNLPTGLVVVRLPSKEENSGPHCGVLIRPKLRKQ